MPVISSRKPYRIGRSRTGLGLFATKPIKKGTKIIRYSGPMLDCRKKKDDAVENKYLFQINGRWTIDGSVRKNIARYINHACKPNAESDVNTRKRTVHIRAIKDIQPGEEINYDYGTEYFKEYLKPIGCKCDACEKKREKLRAEARAAKSGAAKKSAAARKSGAAKSGATKSGATRRAKAVTAARARGTKAAPATRGTKAVTGTAKGRAKTRAAGNGTRAAANPRKAGKRGRNGL